MFPLSVDYADMLSVSTVYVQIIANGRTSQKVKRCTTLEYQIYGPEKTSSVKLSWQFSNSH